MDAYTKDAAQILLDTKSVMFNAMEPFTYTSGRVSPIYVDCRRLISFAPERKRLMDYAADIIKNKCGGVDYVAGGETAGIPYAAYVSDRLECPMLYVRKKPKGFGRNAQIEGCMDEEGKRVVLVEDMQSDGGSKKVFVDALRDAGAVVEHTFVVYHYGIFPQSEVNMKEMGVNLHCLATGPDVLALAKEQNYFDTQTLDLVEDFFNQPEGWAERHGKAKAS
jgi:orotate phosphoribosyltransferase